MVGITMNHDIKEFTNHLPSHEPNPIKEKEAR